MTRLREELGAAKRDSFDVVAFTHSDQDHIANSTEFFELLHEEKYKGKGRIKIRELWVPAAMILEEAESDQRSDEFVIWRQEARYRLKEGKGVQVFSKPDKLKKWLEDNGLTVDSRRHLITDAGQLAKGLSLGTDGVELRNDASLIFQVRFEIDGTRVNYFAVGDSKSDVLEDIVAATHAHKNDERLDWDLFNVPHHCSAFALAPEKGAKETEPVDKVKELLRHGQSDAYVVSSSRPIPDDKAAYEQEQPPHIQARNAYERYLREVDGRKFLVTMEEPNANKPEPLEFEISGGGCTYLGRSITGAAAVITSTPPRAG